MNKNTNFLLLLLLVFSALVSKAGEPKIKLTFGAEYQLPKKHYDVGFIGNAAKGYIQIGHCYGKSISLQKFDKNLRLASEKLIDLKNLPKGYVSESWRETGDNYFWFFSTWNKKEGKERLFAQKIDVQSGNFSGSAQEILQTEKIGSWDKYHFVQSANTKTTLAYWRIVPKEKRDVKNNDRIGMYVYDENMKQIWGKIITMPYTEAEMDNVDYQVDAKGNVYCLAKVYDDRKSKDRTKPNYHYEILIWSKDKPDGSKIPFKFEDKFVSSALIMEDYQGRIIVAGYYSKVFNSGSSDGVFLLKLDQEQGKVVNVLKGLYEFPKELLKEFESERTKRQIEKKEKKKGDVEEPILTLRKININEDGTIQVYGEQYQLVVTTYTDSKGNTHTRYTYYFLDIIALNIGKDGEIVWVKKIPKQQICGTAYGNGFSDFSFDGNKYFFFTDNPKNLNLSPNQAPVTHSSSVKGTVMAVRIDPSGNMKKTVVYDAKDNKVFLNATDFTEVGDNQLITRTAQKKVSRAMLLTFEK